MRPGRTNDHGGTHPAPGHPPLGRTTSTETLHHRALVMRSTSGEALPLDTARWHASATPEEEAILARVQGPVIDLGCGPGRLLVSLARRQVTALGVDASPAAVALARSRGACVLERDLFAPLPGEGRWSTALLFDGNLGIGGDPVRLLTRCRALAHGGGRVTAEVEPAGSGLRRLTVRLELGSYRTPTFAWATVGVEAIGEVAARAGLEVDAVESTPSGRWFAHMLVPHS